GLQTIEAVRRYTARIPDARVIVIDGDSYHIAAVAPELCARHALAHMEAAGRKEMEGGGAKKRIRGRHDDYAPRHERRPRRIARVPGPRAGPPGAHPGPVRARRRRRSDRPPNPAAPATDSRPVVLHREPRRRGRSHWHRRGCQG